LIRKDDDARTPENEAGQGPDDTRLADFAAAQRLFGELQAETEPDLDTAADAPTIPGYHIESQIGGGGGGTVYLAHDVARARAVAIKIMRRPMGGDAGAQRAWREVMLLERLDLPCVPRVVEAGEYEGHLYVVTEYVDGPSLDAYCNDHDLGLRERAELLAEVADALQMLHEHGVIHRDIKPSNILVRSDGRPVIVDLGLASLFGDDATVTITEEGVPVGSPAYMSPEQARGEQSALSTRSDVYSLGATAYWVLLGQTAHDTSGSIHETIHRVAVDPARAPRDLRDDVPRRLAAVLAKSVEMDPTRRYDSAAAMADDLRRFLAGDPVEATPPGRMRRFTRAMQRHPYLVTIAVCLVIIASTSVSSSLVLWRMTWRPYDVRRSPDGDAFVVISVRGAPLKEFQSKNNSPVGDAYFLRDHPMLDGPEIVMSMEMSAEPEWDGHVRRHCARDLDAAPFLYEDEPFEPWAPPPYADVSGSHIGPTTARLMDIFPSRPGDELLVIYSQPPGAVCLLRIYGVDGELLFQRWHYGQLSHAYWMSDPGILILGGIGNDGSWSARGLGDEADHWAPSVVFAIRPRMGDIADSWVSDRAGPHRVEALWYRGIPLPYANVLELPRSAITPLSGDVDSRPVFKLRLAPREDRSIGFSLIVNERGEVVERVVSDGYGIERARQVGTGEGEPWPDPYEVELVELPPVDVR
jgi:serine/threonine protein kinase